MARGVFVKINNYWIPWRFPYVNDTTGKPVKIKAGWTNVAGEWRQFWPPGLPATVVVIGAGGGKGGDDVTAGYVGNPGHRVVGTVGLNSGQDIVIGIGGRGNDGWTGTGNPGGAGGFGGINFGGGQGGASGGLHGWSGSGGGGGGASYLQVDGQNIIIAGGGGGGGGGGWGYVPPPPAPESPPVIPAPAPIPEPSPPPVAPPPVPQEPVPVPPVYPIYIADGEGGALTLWIDRPYDGSGGA